MQSHVSISAYTWQHSHVPRVSPACTTSVQDPLQQMSNQEFQGRSGGMDGESNSCGVCNQNSKNCAKRAPRADRLTKHAPAHDSAAFHHRQVSNHVTEGVHINAQVGFGIVHRIKVPLHRSLRASASAIQRQSKCRA